MPAMPASGCRWQRIRESAVLSQHASDEYARIVVNKH
jgi:hypothetical protein